MVQNKLIAIYYPDAFIENPRSLAAYTVYFDEVHLVTFDDGSVNPTKYLSKLPDKTYIYSFGEKDKKMSKRIAQFYQFAMQYRELIGELLFYEPHLLCKKITELTNKLVGVDGQKLYVDELQEFVNWQTQEQKALNEYYRKFPEVSDEIQLRVAPTALDLSKKNRWLLVSDRAESPVPYFSDTLRNAEQLSSIIAEECLLFHLPVIQKCTAEDILQIRDNLSPELIPFRNMMLKASILLREQVENYQNTKALKQETEFFVKTYINPLVSELEARIKKEQGKLWRRVFGRVIGYVPIVANAFLAPSPENFYKALSKASTDVEDLLLAEHNVVINRDTGISFLLKIRNLRLIGDDA